MKNPPERPVLVVIDRRTGSFVKSLGDVKNPKNLFTRPPNNTVLWRYSDYVRCSNIFTNRTLYFRRADKFKDTLEGRFTPANAKRPSDMFAEAAKQLPTASILSIQESHRNHVYLNCWHKNPEENPRMWKEYTTCTEAIAIRTDLESLFAAMPTEIKGANVNYCGEDYPIPEFHSLSALVHKNRTDFEHENEFRLIYQLPTSEIARSDDKADEGRLIPVDTGRLVHLVRVHPLATEAFKEQVRRDAQAASSRTIIEG